MLRKLLIGVVVLSVVAVALLYYRAQAIFSSELVRTSVEAQISRALGHPVEIGSISATILPRVTMVLSDVRIGSPATITVATLNVGTSARALLSRRIEQATLRVNGARIELPLPRFAIGASHDTADDSPAMSIGSIDEVVLTDVEIVSGGRSLRGDVRVVPRDAGMQIVSMTLRLDDTAVDVTGDITSFQGPTGTLALRASALDMLALQAFATDFAAAAGIGTAPATPSAGAPQAAAMDLLMDITAERATFGALALDTVTGRARLTDEQLAITDMGFGVFEGRYTGALTLGLATTPVFQLKGTLADVSMGALTAWAGTPDAMTGRLAATLDATGAGTTADAVIENTTGAARVDVTQGTVKGLALVRTIVVASSMRSGAAAAAAGGGSEAFSRLGASFNLGEGVARTNNLAFESNDVSLEGAGQVGLDGSNIDLAGRVRLSEALTQQAGRDLVRYTQEGGRVTVPVSISGSAGALSVRLEATDVLRRAVTNKAVEEAGEAVRRGIGGLFNR
ncbi:MAG: AsmA family protein [Acidobacteria bacterium]|nr:AsmA family protein [Acidobacteriota bacterium]